MQRTHSIEDVFDRIEAATGDGRLTLGEAVDALGGRGYGPFLFLPALLEITPFGGIPGVPTLLALLISLFAVQIALGRDRIWAPAVLRARSVEGERLHQAIEMLRPAGQRVERWFPGRLPMLVRGPVRRLAALVVVTLCLTVPALELVPFASTAPMAAIAMIGLALTLRDGLLMALGFALSAGAVGVIVWALLRLPI
ncbi:exopolysaccharide biosynthesis protein [Roseivivax sp.]